MYAVRTGSFGDQVIHRERAWREGSWEQLTGRVGSPRHIDFGGRDDRVACDRLPLKYQTFDTLQVLASPTPLQKTFVGHRQEAALLWQRQLRCEAMCCAPVVLTPAINYDAGPEANPEYVSLSLVVLVSENGTSIEAIGVAEENENIADQEHQQLAFWKRASPEGSSIVAVKLAPQQGTTPPLLALGDDMCTVHLWHATTGQPLCSFVVAVPVPLSSGLTPDGHKKRRSAACGWVEVLCWSSDGQFLAASAGRISVVASISTTDPPNEGSSPSHNATVAAEVVQGVQAGRTRDAIAKGGSIVSGTVTAICSRRRRVVETTGSSRVPQPSSPQSTVGPECFAVGGYGGVGWLAAANPSDRGGSRSVAQEAQLLIGATATLTIAASPCGSAMAVGCLDKRLRLFDLISSDSGGVPTTSSSSTDAAAAETKNATSLKQPRDWVGFDGPVGMVKWSARGGWLAAIGGTTLLVVPKDLPRGEPPIRCLLPSLMGSTACVECPPVPTESTTFGVISWCPLLNVDGRRECLLAAMETPSGRAHVYNVSPGCAEDAVPRRVAPLVSVAPPGGTVSSSLMHVHFLSVATKYRGE
jgi:hypothetical protein